MAGRPTKTELLDMPATVSQEKDHLLDYCLQICYRSLCTISMLVVVSIRNQLQHLTTLSPTHDPMESIKNDLVRANYWYCCECDTAMETALICKMYKACIECEHKRCKTCVLDFIEPRQARQKVKRKI